MRETAFWSTHKDKNRLQHCIQPVMQANLNTILFFFLNTIFLGFFFSRRRMQANFNKIRFFSKLFFYTFFLMSNASEFQ